MPAYPKLGSTPAAGITVDGIVDVLGGKSIVRKFLASGDVLKGQLVEESGVGVVKASTADVTIANLRGVAVSSASTGEVVSVLRSGVARVVLGSSKTQPVVGDQIKTVVDGYMEKYESGNAVGYVESYGAGYADIGVNLLDGAV